MGTFLCPIDYPLKSSIKSSIYFSGPTSFANSNEIWIELQLKLQEMSTNNIGEQHLFDIVQFAKEWIEKFEERYSKNQKYEQESSNFNKKHEFIELRTALGLIDEKDKKFSAYYSIKHNDDIDDISLVQINNENIANKNGAKSGVDMMGKTYIWYWKDI